MPTAVKPKNKIVFLSFMRIFAMMCIVVSHSMQQGYNPEGMQIAVPYLQKAALAVFMWVSAYLLIKTDSIARYGYLPYVKKRAVKLMTPFFVIQLLLIAPKYLLALRSNKAMDISIKSIVMDFIIPRNGILPHLWFLPTLMILTLISPVLIRIIKSKIGSVCLVAVGIALCCIENTTEVLGVNDVKNNLLWYALGMICAYYLKDNEFQNKTHMVLLTIISTIAYAVSVLTLPINHYTWIVITFFALVMLTALLALIGKKTEKFCNFIGIYTFPIYILSLPLQNALDVVGGGFGLPVYARFVIETVLAISVPLIIAMVVERIEKNRKHKILSTCIGM